MDSSDFHARLIAIKATKLRFEIRKREMADPGQMTPQSIAYRRKASALAEEARNLAQTDPAQEIALLQKAIFWIQLAENDELLAGYPVELQ